MGGSLDRRSRPRPSPECPVLLARRLSPLVLAWVALALAPACSMGPAVVVSTPHGLVRAPTETSAQALAEMVSELYPEVGARLPGAEDSRPDVWLQEQLDLPWYTFAGDGLTGAHLDFVGRVYLEQAPRREMATTLAHEYVHARMDEVFARLPHALQEGLCDHIAEELVPEFAAEHRARRLLQALNGLGRFEVEVHYSIPDVQGRHGARLSFEAQGIDPGRVFEHGTVAFWFLDLEEKSGLYGLGLVAVDRLVRDGGYAGLHAFLEATADGELAERLAARAGVEPAGVTGDGVTGAGVEGTEPLAAWLEALFELFGEEELAALAVAEPALVAGLAAVIGRARFPDLDAETFLTEGRPRLSMPHHGRSVPIYADPVVCEAVRAAWPVLDPAHALERGSRIEALDD